MTTEYHYVAGSRKSLSAEYGSSAPSSAHAGSHVSGKIYLLQWDVMYEFSVTGTSPSVVYAFIKHFNLLEPNNAINPFSPVSGSYPSGVHAMCIQSTQMVVFAGLNIFKYTRSTGVWMDYGQVPCP